MNNDFPAENGIRKLTIPTVISHSKSDEQVPYKLRKKIFESANKNNTKFQDADNKHIMRIYDYVDKYVREFIKMTKK
jgi:fermentation-respiration switch protein FrsA (DUF1100 family)